MTRQHALARLQEALWMRRENLRNTLADHMANLRHIESADATGDSADAAFEADSNEVSSQLAELDTRELSQIDPALVRLKQGKYGACEICDKRIPLARLNAIPYATLCITCERQLESSPRWLHRPGKGNWGQVIDSDARAVDRRSSVSEMEMALSRNR